MCGVHCTCHFISIGGHVGGHALKAYLFSRYVLVKEGVQKLTHHQLYLYVATSLHLASYQICTMVSWEARVNQHLPNLSYFQKLWVLGFKFFFGEVGWLTIIYKVYTNLARSHKENSKFQESLNVLATSQKAMSKYGKLTGFCLETWLIWWIFSAKNPMGPSQPLIFVIKQQNSHPKNITGFRAYKTRTLEREEPSLGSSRSSCTFI